MAIINLLPVPAELRDASPSLERHGELHGCVREVPGLLGWAVHVGVRTTEFPLRTHVCATAYDHISIDVAPSRVAALYERHPQEDTFVSLAGLPDTVTAGEAIDLLQSWGVSALPERDWNPTLSPSTVYVARPIFVLHSGDAGRTPLAIVACRVEIAHLASDRVDVDVGLDTIAVHPEHRHQGLGHLALLEASRWIGMFTRSLLFSEHAPFALRQRMHASPKSAAGYHFAQAFLSNFMYFTITDELLDNAREEHRTHVLEPGGVRAGLTAITRLVGVEDLIQIPDDAFEYLEQGQGESDLDFVAQSDYELEEEQE